MESASNRAYISKNYIAKYQQKRNAHTEQEAQEQKIIKEEKLGSGSDDEQNRSVEEVLSDDLENQLNYSDEEPTQQQQQQKESKKLKKKKQQNRVFKQEVDTNVQKINFATLKDQAELATGDPCFCSNCKAIFNQFSKLEEVKTEEGEEQQIWKCEFCNFSNSVSFEKEELPKSYQVNYIVQAAAQVNEKQMLGKQDISVVFCIDSSGSMCVSQPVAGKHSIKGDKVKQLNQDLSKFGDGSDQRLQGEQNVTYISRMQCVQAAIDNQITEMSHGAPTRKVGLVTFSSEINLIGDSSKGDLIIAGDKLHDYDYLLDTGINQAQERMKKPIIDTKEALSKKLLSIEESGPTALGPALLSSIGLSSQGAPGSQVIICTDGLANVGLGAFDDIKSEQESKAVDKFYEQMGEYAQNHGVMVNIVSIEGEECNIDTLSKIAELTGGNVDRVNPLQLASNFANILSLPVIATNVILKVKLHKGLEFRNEDPLSLSEDKSLLVKSLGNVTEETEITFEYRLKQIKELLKMKDVDLSQMNSFPFQAQIEYTDLNGSKCVRVISKQEEISNDREELEQNADYRILSTNAIQQSSKLVKQGQFRGAQAYAKCWNRKMRSQMHEEEQVNVYKEYNKQFGEMYNKIQEAHEEESDGEGQEEEEQKQDKKPVITQKNKVAKSDAFSTKLYQVSKTTTKAFKK